MSPRTIATYAPAAPFIAAAEGWITVHVRWIEAEPPRTPIRNTPRHHAIRALAAEAGLNRKFVAALMAGERNLIELRQADKLSMALDIPLRMLAEDFLPLKELRGADGMTTVPAGDGRIVQPGVPVTPEEAEQMRDLRAQGLTEPQVAEIVGRSLNTVGVYARGFPRGGVDTAPIREAFLRSPLTPSDVCVRLGWTFPHPRYPQGKPDTSHLERTLGLRADRDGRGHITWRKRMNHDLAARVIRALDLDPVDFGL